MTAVFAAKAGEFTPVVKDISSMFVAQVEDIRSDSVIVDAVHLSNGSFLDQNGLTKDQLTEYYGKNKETYRREVSRKLEYLVAREDNYREDAEKAATDGELTKYFDANKAKWQTGSPENPTVPKFEDVKDKVKEAFIGEKIGKLAEEALAKVKEDVAKEGANLKTIAKTNKLESRSVDYKTEKELGSDPSLKGIDDLAATIFALKKGEVSGVLKKSEAPQRGPMGPAPTPEKELCLFKVVDVKEPYIPELKEVETKVRGDLDKEQSAARALEAAGKLKAQIEKALADGKKFEDVTKDDIEFTKHIKPSFQTTDSPFTRRLLNPYYGMYEGQGQYSGGFTPANEYQKTEHVKFTEAAFSTPRGVVAGPVREETEQRAVYLLSLRQLVEPDKLDEKTMKYSRYTPERMIQQEMVESTITQIGIKEFLKKK